MINRDTEILIVDDSPEQIHMVNSILKKEDFKVKATVDSREVLNILENGKISLILLDILMPDISGIDLCKIIKSNSRYSTIPVIFLTGLTDNDTIVEAFSAGAQDYVAKPVNSEELLARVHAHLQLKYKTEKLELAYKEIESFNHMICHDLKSPLWAIKSLVEFLNEYIDVSEDDAVHLLSKLNEKAQESILLIEKLSALSKVSSDALMIEHIDMNVLMTNVHEVLVSENVNRNIQYNQNNIPDIYGDKILIKQVFYNILSNAFKYTRNCDTAKIEVSCIENDADIILCIRDNGTGFDMTYSDKLFNMFQRFHNKNEFEGTGAGLAIAKKIIERHNGKIWLSSEVDKGTSAYVKLPSRTAQ